MIDNFWLWQFLGRLHPLIVHFPIGLLIVALFLEVIAIRKKSNELRPAINILLVTGAACAVLSVAFGWLLEEQDSYSGDVLVLHKWTGIATAALAIAAAFLHGRAVRGVPQLITAYRAVLVTTVVGVTIAGHLGASLTLGSDFLASTLPWNSNETIPRNPDFDVARLASTGQGQLTEEQIADLNLEVRSIFAHNCYKCHSSEKIKGELRLDKKEFVFKGGESGPVIVPGDPDQRKENHLQKMRLRLYSFGLRQELHGLTTSKRKVFIVWRNSRRVTHRFLRINLD
jgi:uncharacterized membrane protein